MMMLAMKIMTLAMLMTMMTLAMTTKLKMLRSESNNPSHAKFPLGGSLPPPGAITGEIFPKS